MRVRFSAACCGVHNVKGSQHIRRESCRYVSITKFATSSESQVHRTPTDATEDQSQLKHRSPTSKDSKMAHIDSKRQHGKQVTHVSTNRPSSVRPRACIQTNVTEPTSSCLARALGSLQQQRLSGEQTKPMRFKQHGALQVVRWSCCGRTFGMPYAAACCAYNAACCAAAFPAGCWPYCCAYCCAYAPAVLAAVACG